MSVSRIFRLGQKESRWTPQQESSGIRFYRSFNSLARYLVEDHVRIILLCKGKNFFYIISGLIICFHSSRRIIIDTIIILQAFTSKNALVKVQIIAKLFPCNQIAISSPAPIYIAIHCVLPCRIKSILSVAPELCFLFFCHISTCIITNRDIDIFSQTVLVDLISSAIRLCLILCILLRFIVYRTFCNTHRFALRFCHADAGR